MTSDDEFVNSIENMSDSIKQCEAGILRYLHQNPTIDAGSKTVIDHVLHGSFEAISQLYKYISFNTKIIYDLRYAINKLPDKREYDEIKNVVRQSISAHEQDRQFVQKARRYFNDLMKDVEKPEGSL
jgi:hypothetical protein